MSLTKSVSLFLFGIASNMNVSYGYLCSSDAAFQFAIPRLSYIVNRILFLIVNNKRKEIQYKPKIEKKKRDENIWKLGKWWNCGKAECEQSGFEHARERW